MLARYRAAVDCKRELDPNFVIMAQCYVGEANNGSFDEALRRMRLYREEAQADWVQFTAPRSLDEIRRRAPWWMDRSRSWSRICRRRWTMRICSSWVSRCSGRRA